MDLLADLNLSNARDMTFVMVRLLKEFKFVICFVNFYLFIGSQLDKIKLSPLFNTNVLLLETTVDLLIRQYFMAEMNYFIQRRPYWTL